MKVLLITALLATAALAAPMDDTEDVKKAKAEFKAAFDMAEKGEHASLAPKNEYLEDAADVKAAKAQFKAAFELDERGIPAALVSTPKVLAPAPLLAAAPWAAPLAHAAYAAPWGAAPLAYTTAYHSAPIAYTSAYHSAPLVYSHGATIIA